MSPPTLTPEECRKERTPDELYTWLFDKIDLFHSLSQEDSGLERQVLLHEGKLFKRFHEEIYPLAFFAKHYYEGRTDIIFRPDLGSRNYDAEIVDRSGATIFRVEVTQAFFDREESCRMEYYLDETRRDLVWLTGPIDCEGTKRTGHKITLEEDCEEDEYWQEQYRRAVCDRLAKKGTKPHGHYEANTLLIVAVDDYARFVTRHSQELLNQVVAQTVASPTWPFAGTFLVGIAQRYFDEFPSRGSVLESGGGAGVVSV